MNSHVRKTVWILISWLVYLDLDVVFIDNSCTLCNYMYMILQAAIEREKAKAKAAEKAAGGGGGKERAKSPGKGKGGGKKTPEPQQAKDGSKLRKRGEEDPDGKYIGR